MLMMSRRLGRCENIGMFVVYHLSYTYFVSIHSLAIGDAYTYFASIHSLAIGEAYLFTIVEPAM